MLRKYFFFLADFGSLEKEMATHSSILAWRIPRTEEPGKLQSMEFQTVRHDWVTHKVKNLPAIAGDIRDLCSILRLGRSPGGGHGNPLQYSCLENPMDRGAWWATNHGVARSPTQLKRLSRHKWAIQIPDRSSPKINVRFGIYQDVLKV